MFAKVFSSLYDGSLRGRPHEILVFTNLLTRADANGEVDRHFRAIAEDIGLTVEETKAAILVLESPDPESRSPEEEGRRIARLEDHRTWGWRIINYAKYRAIRHAEDRRAQVREAVQRHRKKKKEENK